MGKFRKAKSAKSNKAAKLNTESICGCRGKKNEDEQSEGCTELTLNMGLPC